MGYTLMKNLNISVQILNLTKQITCFIQAEDINIIFMLGVQTIGNATLIAYDKHPIISTDPWMGGDHYAYFGSWKMPYDIPEDIRENICKSEYIWFSHGHPDHINHDSLNLFKNNKK